jgi:hypothetical protein
LSHPEPFDPAPRGLWTGGSVISTLLAAALLLALSSPVSAQVAAPAPTTPPTQTAITRSLTLEYIIVVAMIGAAVFAVCRSSRRN